LIFRFAQSLVAGTRQALQRSSKGDDGGDPDMAREAPAQSPPPKGYPAEKARGGEIILKTPLQRWVFIAGLIGAVVLVLVLAFLR
jgi:hypothetical protein